MKRTLSTPARRFAAAMLALSMLAGAFAFPAQAGYYDDDSYDADYAEYEQVSQDFTDTWDLPYDEQEAAYAALRQKYPDRPDVALEAVQQSYYDDPNAELAAYDEVIQLAQTAQKSSSKIYVYFNSEWEIIQRCYEEKAMIYLTKLYQQENYISSMRCALDAEEQASKVWLNSDINWLSAVEGLQKVQAKRNELDAIERWYQAGSPQNFTAWNGRVQVTGGAGDHVVQVQMETPNGKDSDWIELPSGDWEEKINMEYSSVLQEFCAPEPNCQPVSMVLRSLNNVYFVIPDYYSSFRSISHTTTFYKKDGTTVTETEWPDPESIGLIADFFNVQNVSMPAEVQHFMKTVCSEDWNAGGSPYDIVYYGVSIQDSKAY